MSAKGEQVANDLIILYFCLASWFVDKHNASISEQHIVIKC